MKNREDRYEEEKHIIAMFLAGGQGSRLKKTYRKNS